MPKQNNSTSIIARSLKGLSLNSDVDLESFTTNSIAALAPLSKQFQYSLFALLGMSLIPITNASVQHIYFQDPGHQSHYKFTIDDYYNEVVYALINVLNVCHTTTVINDLDAYNTTIINLLDESLYTDINSAMDPIVMNSSPHGAIFSRCINDTIVPFFENCINSFFERAADARYHSPNEVRNSFIFMLAIISLITLFYQIIRYNDINLSRPTSYTQWLDNYDPQYANVEEIQLIQNHPENDQSEIARIDAALANETDSGANRNSYQTFNA
jgi:hypothetical protein